MKRTILIVTLAVTLITILFIFGVWHFSFSHIPDLFRLNKECQEEGYYMGEFEFKMLGLAYYLDKGEYVKAVRGINKLHKQLKTREGLIKVPKFTDKKQELEFYLSLQNPRTGAFMDDTYPYCFYEGPTGNVLEHLEALAKATGQPLRLTYPLKFFDEINTSDALNAFLDDIANIGWLAAKFPQTSFHIARNHLHYCEAGNILERNHLYTFSPEWKQALIKWFYENQDPETGFWGPRSRNNGKLVKIDLNNTSSIIKNFVDDNGHDIHASLPLRYKSEMFATTLDVLSKPMPADNELDELHEWDLSNSKGLKMLVKYLWPDASQEHKDKAKKLIEAYIKIKFEKYYVPDEGAFSFYPDADHATLDGISGILGFFKDIGAFSRERQRNVWEISEQGSFPSQIVTVSQITENDVQAIVNAQDVNSIRVYDPRPDAETYLSNVSAVMYPKATRCLDAADLLPRIKNWLESTSQSMGNWVSKGVLLQEEALQNVQPAKMITNHFPLDSANAILNQHKEVVVIGFDLLQIPRCQMTFRLQ